MQCSLRPDQGHGISSLTTRSMQGRSIGYYMAHWQYYRRYQYCYTRYPSDQEEVRRVSHESTTQDPPRLTFLPGKHDHMLHRTGTCGHLIRHRPVRHLAGLRRKEGRCSSPSTSDIGQLGYRRSQLLNPCLWSANILAHEHGVAPSSSSEAATPTSCNTHIRT